MAESLPKRDQNMRKTTSMWVKMTEQEVRASKRIKWQRLIRFGIVGGCFAVFMILFHPVWENSHRAGRVRSLEELKVLAPVMFAVGVLLGLFFYVVPKERRRLSCLECGATTPAGGIDTCSCGGAFEDIRRHTWIEKPNNTSEDIVAKRAGSPR